MGGGNAPAMDGPNPTLNPAEFGSFENYLQHELAGSERLGE